MFKKSSLILLGQLEPNLVKWSLCDLLSLISEICLATQPQPKMATINWHSLNIGPYGEKIKNLVLYQFGPNFDGMVLKWSLFRILSGGRSWSPWANTFFIGPYGKNVGWKIFSATTGTWPIKTSVKDGCH